MPTNFKDFATMTTEPVSTAAGGAALWKLLGLGALVGTGVLGAVMMAVFDPPKDRKTMFGQAAIAGVSSLFFGPVTVRLVDHYFDFINMATGTWVDAMEVAAPVYLLIGALSWGAFGALVTLRRLIKQKGGQFLGDKLGLPKDTQ